MTGAHRTLAKGTGIAANVLLLALSLVAAYLLPTYPLFVFSLAVVNIIAVLGVNLVMGYAGQISLGHAGFAAIGAYATALLVGSYDLSFWLALALGGFLAAAFGFLLGGPARGMGINIAHYKTVAFAVGAFYAGISGGLFAGLAQFVNPDAFVFPVSILYVTMGILGGIGSLAGAALGGLMLTGVAELLRGAAEYKDFLTGLLLLVLLIFLPKGVVGVLQKSFGSLLRARAGATLSAVSVELPGGLRAQVGGTDFAANPPCEEPRATAASDPLLKV